MTDRDPLGDVRAQIDQLDLQLQELLNARAKLAQEVAGIKQANGDDTNFYRPEREAKVLREVKARNAGPLPDEEVARLFREIMSACLALEAPLRVAFLGPEGTFTQDAACKHFGHSVRAVPMAAIDEVFREVESGAVNYGVVPVENSTEGMISHTLDMFINSPLHISGEVQLRIHHQLLSTGDSLDAVQRVYSHQQSLAQCREWLDHNLPGVARQAVSSNAEAARMASESPGTAAIASHAAGGIYHLHVLAANIEDEPDNTTRFLIVGTRNVPPSGDDKTSLLLSAANRSGALLDLLKPFSANDINMTRIESRPSRRGVWEYVFFVDIEGHVDDPRVSKAIAGLREMATAVKVLGSYPRAVI